MSLHLDLEKGRKALQLNLEKRGLKEPPEAELAFCLDVSSSFDAEHRSGSTQRLLERLVPWGMLFDPDKKMDVFTFSGGDENAHYVGDVSPASVEGFIQKRIIERVPGYNGGTDYSYVLRKALRHFGWTPAGMTSSGQAESRIRPGFFRRLFFGEKTELSQPAAASPLPHGKRSIVHFVTDGENSAEDRARTHRVLSESQNRKDEAYFLFIGCGNKQEFSFLEEIADKYSNTGLVIVEDVKKFASFSDEELNEVLVGDELLEWLKK